MDASIASRVLAGDQKRVSKGTRLRILAAADELGWRPHPAAKSLRTGTTTALALIVPNIQNPAYGSMIRGAQRAAAAADHVLVVADTAYSNTRERDELRRISMHVDGIIIASARTTDVAKEDFLSTMVPTVLLNRRGMAGLPAVLGPDDVGARLAAGHLADLGHPRIAILSGPASVDTATRRVAAFEAALAERGTSVSHRASAELEVADAAAAAADLLRMPEGERLTAIFAAGLSAALGVVQAARSLGLRIPEDVSLIGFDDAEIAEFLTPGLTTVRMPHEQMGVLAVESLFALMRRERLPDTIAVTDQPELIVRGTTMRYDTNRSTGVPE